jgi:hypothetical protein
MNPMSSETLLSSVKKHLSNLLEVVQRCAYFLNASDKAVIRSVEEWQVARVARNLAAHDYEINYDDVADHFNTLNTLTPNLYQTAKRFIVYCETELKISPCSPDFS